MIPVARLATAVSLLGRRRQTVSDLVNVVDCISQAHLVAVAGERALMLGLKILLAKASTEIDLLVTVSADEVDDAVERLERLLHLPEWTVAAEAVVRLDEQKVLQQQEIQRLSEHLGTFQQAVSQVRYEVEATLRAGGEVDQAVMRAVAELDGAIHHAARSAARGRYDSAAVAVKKTQKFVLNGAYIADPKQFEITLTGIRAQRIAAEQRDVQMSLRTELFVMSTVDDDRIAGMRYRVLLRRPAGAGSAQETSLYYDREINRYDRARFRSTVVTIAEQATAGVRSRATTSRHVDVDEPEEELPVIDFAEQMKSVGKQLYKLLIPEEMRLLISKTTCALRVTSNDLELPWELMHDGEDYLSLKRPLARMPVGKTYSQLNRPGAQQIQNSWQMLLIHSDPDDNLPDAEKEIEAIKLLGERGDLSITQLKPSDATMDNVSNELVSGHYDLIHYAGHAGFEDDDPATCYLLLHDQEKFDAQRIQDLVEGTPIVFLNACDSAAISNEKPTPPMGSIVREAQGLASAFVYAGASACVGTLWPVFDDTAYTLATSFYELLFSRRRVGDALCGARTTTRRKHKDGTTWAAYALYGDPAAQLRPRDTAI